MTLPTRVIRQASNNGGIKQHPVLVAIGFQQAQQLLQVRHSLGSQPACQPLHVTGDGTTQEGTTGLLMSKLINAQAPGHKHYLIARPQQLL